MVSNWHPQALAKSLPQALASPLRRRQLAAATGLPAVRPPMAPRQATPQSTTLADGFDPSRPNSNSVHRTTANNPMQPFAAGALARFKALRTVAWLSQAQTKCQHSRPSTGQSLYRNRPRASTLIALNHAPHSTVQPPHQYRYRRQHRHHNYRFFFFTPAQTPPQ